MVWNIWQHFFLIPKLRYGCELWSNDWAREPFHEWCWQSESLESAIPLSGPSLRRHLPVLMSLKTRAVAIAKALSRNRLLTSSESKTMLALARSQRPLRLPVSGSCSSPFRQLKHPRPQDLTRSRTVRKEPRLEHCTSFIKSYFSSVVGDSISSSFLRSSTFSAFSFATVSVCSFSFAAVSSRSFFSASSSLFLSSLILSSNA